VAQEQTYTEPELRARPKQEIQAGDRGGRPGQRSARTTVLAAIDERLSARDQR
jgi:hypothetical protein